MEEKSKNRGVYFMLSEDKFEKMKKYAQELYMTQSAFIRYCIDKEIKRLEREDIYL